MDNKSNSVPSVGTEVENNTNVEDTSVNPNGTKPIVGCSATSFEPINFGIEESFEKRINQWSEVEKNGFLKL